MARKSNPARGSKKGERRGGRKPGTPNLLTRELKDMIRGALDKVGGQKYLETCARTEPKAFLLLLGKILPKEITGAGGTPLVPSLPGMLRQMSEEELLAVASGATAKKK
jgi:hypothetical protein